LFWGESSPAWSKLSTTAIHSLLFMCGIYGVCVTTLTITGGVTKYVRVCAYVYGCVGVCVHWCVSVGLFVCFKTCYPPAPCR